MKNVVKCDTWCKLQNLVNHRVFERKLHPKPSGRGHVCPDVTNRRPPILSRIWDGSCSKSLDDQKSSTRPQLRRDHPLSLSISISGGKETNKESLSNSEGTGRSPA
ncbi:hypothetical protein N665_1192s0003 [Sinapis alba]|nr:hypothetical protein N665_1192s0003 [Sinapis alba]